MAKPHNSRTSGPVNFEDLEPHRSEDLVRELVYDFKEWQSIEALEKGDADDGDGFDIRACEQQVFTGHYVTDEEKEEPRPPGKGKLWIIRYKKEAAVGPAKIPSLIKGAIDAKNPPYGYILAASANFSQKSYDIFRDELRQLGVMEFYLWGNAELENMLHMPRYDRTLFTFFGISHVSRNRSRAMEVRFSVSNKNKLYRIFEDKQQDINKRILVRDIKDREYPNRDKHADFNANPRWRSVMARQLAPKGLWVQYHEYFAYINREKKEWDYSVEFDLMYEPNSMEEREINKFTYLQRMVGVQDFWEYFPVENQGKVYMWGHILFEDMLLVDDVGDALYKFPHIYADFRTVQGPFHKLLNILRIGNETFHAEADGFNRVPVFPKEVPEKRLGTVYRDKKIRLEPEVIQGLNSESSPVQKYYEYENHFDFLKPKDVIAVENTTSRKETFYIRITCKYKVKTGDYLAKSGGAYMKEVIQRQTGREPGDEDMLTVYEFRKLYGS